MLYFIYAFSCFGIIGSLLPLLDNEHWIVRGQSYFRAIYLVLDLILIVLLVLFAPFSIWNLLLIVLLVFALILCLKSILPFTPLAPIQVQAINERTNKQELSILVYNVYQFNHKFQKLIDLVHRESPDVVFLIETNTDWSEGVKELKNTYPFNFSDIRENTYGVMLFSKIEILEGGLNYLVKTDIPSIEFLCEVEGSKVRILGLHPRPPIPGESLSSRSKDKELVQAADYLNKQEEDDHQILIGDLNDVAWSRATRAFKKSTGMLDPRAGRGFYPTFPTWSPIGIPLDHVFCSPALKIIKLKRLENIGSDHYPLLVVFHIPEKN